MGCPEREDFFQGLDIGPELFGLANLDGERQGIAGSAKLDGHIRVVHSFGKDGDAAQHEALKFLAGEAGGLLAKAGQLVAEAIFFEPTAQGTLADPRRAGGLSNSRGGGDDGEGRPLAKGEVGFFDYPLISAHFPPFGTVGRVGVRFGGGRRGGLAGRLGAVGPSAVSGHLYTVWPQWRVGFGLRVPEGRSGSDLHYGREVYSGLGSGGCQGEFGIGSAECGIGWRVSLERRVGVVVWWLVGGAWS